jgi:hypothetical protein
MNMNFILGILVVAVAVGLAIVTDGLFLPVCLPLALYGLNLMGVQM